MAVAVGAEVEIRDAGLAVEEGLAVKFVGDLAVGAVEEEVEGEGEVRELRRVIEVGKSESTRQASLSRYKEFSLTVSSEF